MRYSRSFPLTLAALIAGAGLCAHLSAQGFARAGHNPASKTKGAPIARHDVLTKTSVKTVALRSSGAPVAGYTQVDGLSLGASDYCPMPGAKINLTATLSGSGSEKVQISFSTGGSCEAKPGDSCTVPYSVPGEVGDIKATASAKGKTSNEITIKVQTQKDWKSEPALDAGKLAAKLQTAGPNPTPPPVVPPPTGDPQAPATPTPTPVPSIPTGTRRFAPGSTVSVSVKDAFDDDTCTRCGTNEEEQADQLKYKWTGGDAGAGNGGTTGGGTEGGTGAGADEGSSKTITIPAQVGQSVEVSVEVDDKAEKAAGDTGSRDDGAQTLTMTVYAAHPNPNDPDKDGDGFPESQDPDGDEPEPDPTPTPNPQPTATPGPNPTPKPPRFMPGGSQLYWRVLRPEDLYDGDKSSIDGALGGTVAIQVIVQVGRKGRVDPALSRYAQDGSAASSLTFRLQEKEDTNNKVKHDDAENHADVSVILNDNRWDVWTSQESTNGNPPPPELQLRADGAGPCGNINGCAGNAMSENGSDDLSYFYTKTILWDTTKEKSGAGSKLLGHNGGHTISLVKVNDQESDSINFQKKFPDQEEWQDAEFEAQETTHEVGNLVITKAESTDGNLDYLRFDPQSSDEEVKSPSLLLNFQDGAFVSGDHYRYKVTFVDTDTATAHQVSDTVTEVPTEPIYIDLPQPMEPGCYGFQVDVVKFRESQVEGRVVETVVDTQSLRSQYLFFNGTGLEVVGEENEGNPPVSFTYRISKTSGAPDGLKPLSTLKIVAVDGVLKQGGETSGPKEISVEGEESYSVNAPVIDNPEAGTGHVIATGVDDEAARYRNHENHRLVPFNAVWRYYRVISLEGHQSHIQINGKKPVLNLEIATGARGQVLNIRFDKEKGTNTIGSGSPRDIWQWLSKFPQSRLPNGGPSYSPVVVNVFGQGDHGSDDFEHYYQGTSAAQIGQQTPSGVSGRSSWIMGSYPKYLGATAYLENNQYSLNSSNYDGQSVPYLKGISFFNVATSFSAANGNGRDIAARIGVMSRLSVGYQKRLEGVSDSLYQFPSGTVGFRPTDNVAQHWYDFLYSAPGGMGTVRSIAGSGKTRRVAWSDSNAAFNATTAKYNVWFTTKSSAGGLTGVNPSGDTAGPDSTSTYYGWDMWTLSRPTIPILEY